MPASRRVLPFVLPAVSALTPGVHPPRAQVLDTLRRPVQVAITASYVLDALFLAAFVYAGALAASVPELYLGLGAAESVLAWLLSRGPWAWHAPALTMARMSASCAIQLVLICVASAVSLYFIGVLFIVFGFGSLRLRVRELGALWILVAIALVAISLWGVDVLQLPHQTVEMRAIGLVAALSVLARCTLLGLFSSYLRHELVCHYDAVRVSLKRSEDYRTHTSFVLHEELGQDIAGIAMKLSAHAAWLRRRDPGEAREIDETTAQLRTVVEKARVLAFPALPRGHAKPDPLATGDSTDSGD